MRLRLGRFELASARADSADVQEREAWREQGQAILNDVPRLRPEQHRTGQLGRLASDGWTSGQVRQFIETWPTASAATLIKLLSSANEMNRGGGDIDVTKLAATSHERYEIDARGRAHRRT